MNLAVGDTIGDYRITGLLGRGGMGQVFRVRNLISEREEAMKIVLPDLHADPGIADRFLREIKVHASLVHPNIAALHTAVHAGDRILMVMELVEGVSLEERLREGRLDATEGVRCLDQVLSALAFAHERGVIHRDIKPANIIVTREGVTKLTDFGIARAAGDRRITSTGMALGSLYYMSPEQVMAAPVDERSDIYSVGVTLYEVVAGRRPIQGDSEYSILNAHLEQVPVPPAALVPDLPERLSQIVMKSLAKKPAERFQTAREFQAALRGMDAAATVMLPFPPAELARVEARLAERLGPIARSLVALEARRFSTLPEVCRSLAGHIPEPVHREAFLRACATGTAPALPPAGTSTAPLDPALLEAARQSLAPYLGPIARVIVDKTARRVGTPQQLYEALAAEIPEERDRRAFLSSLPR